jgi:hypothetical protein
MFAAKDDVPDAKTTFLLWIAYVKADNCKIVEILGDHPKTGQA